MLSASAIFPTWVANPLVLRISLAQNGSSQNYEYSYTAVRTDLLKD